MNDTVVVYDRVREKLRKYKKMDISELLDIAINQTLSRTVMTCDDAACPDCALHAGRRSYSWLYLCHDLGRAGGHLFLHFHRRAIAYSAWCQARWSEVASG